MYSNWVPVVSFSGTGREEGFEAEQFERVKDPQTILVIQSKGKQ